MTSNFTKSVGIPTSVKNFSNSPKKRKISISTFTDNSLKMPSAQERAMSVANRPVSANPPISIENNPNKIMEELRKTSVDRGIPNENSIAVDMRKDKTVPLQQKVVIEPVIEPKYEEVELRIEDSTKIDNPFAERIVLPSNCIFYNFNSIIIRPFLPVELPKLYKACKNRDYILYYDVINATINVDIRDLWPVDANHILHWHRINSFIRSPYNIDWTSMYGNENTTKIEYTNVVTTPLKMTKKEYKNWQLKGLQIPTIRDFEHFESFKNTLEDEEKWSFERAMFIQKDCDLRGKKQFLDEQTNLNLIYDINEFSEQLAKGKIVSSLSVKDSKFNYEKGLEKLEKDLEIINSILNEENLDDRLKELVLEKKNEYEPEIERLKGLQPGEAEPKLETIELRLDLFNFFPKL